MPGKVKPTPIALVVCDNIYQEPGGKTALVGLFNSINAYEFPVKHPRMAIFASVTGVRSGSIAKLEIVNAETADVVVSVEGPFPKETDPLTVVDMNFIINDVIFHEEGMYNIIFWGNEYPLIMRPFEVNKIQHPKGH